MNWNRQKRGGTILGITVDDGTFEAVLLRRSNGSAEVLKTLEVDLSLDVSRDETELLGHELRGHLEAAGIRERHCVVGLSAHRLLTIGSALSDIPDEDVGSCLELEAERGFPVAPDQLQICVSRYSCGGARFATQIGVTNDQVERLEAILSAAQLKPMSFSLGIATLPGAVADQAAITLIVRETRVEMLVSAGGGIVALRSIDNVSDIEGSVRRLRCEAIVREMRITIGQLPDAVRNTIGNLRIFGAPAFAAQVADGLRNWAEHASIAIMIVDRHPGEEAGIRIGGASRVGRALSLAAAHLGTGGSRLEFLPPKPSVWEQFTRRHSGKRLAYGGTAAGSLAAIVVLLLVFQQFRLSALEGRWNGMMSQVGELREMQDRIRGFRSWYDPEPTSLKVLRQVTEAFPEEGTVTTKIVEIHDRSRVNVTGIATDNSALLDTLNTLRDASTVGDLKVDQIRGKSPLQFTFNFEWKGDR